MALHVSKWITHFYIINDMHDYTPSYTQLCRILHFIEQLYIYIATLQDSVTNIYTAICVSF